MPAGRDAARHGDPGQQQQQRQPLSEPARDLPALGAPGHEDDPRAAVDLPAVAPPTAARTRTYVAVAVASGILFLAVSGWVVAHGAVVPGVDARIHDWAVATRTPATVTIARVVTWGGATVLVLPALVAVGAASARGALRNRLGRGVLLAGVASIGVYVGLRISSLLGRGRPASGDWAAAAGGAAYPSGHATAATLFALACAWAVSARLTAGWARRAVWVAAAGYAGAVGATRVWLGVHWSSDVAAGWLYALVWFAATTAVLLALRRRQPGTRPASARAVPRGPLA